jgi:hypothetical protein
MPELEPTITESGVAAGEAFLADTPVLRSHVGTQPDLFLRWNRLPADVAALDVVVHLHGFAASGRDMQLADKVEASGLDLSVRARPTLALLPRGNWLRYSWYDFPALLEAGGLDGLVEYALLRFSAALSGQQRRLALDRLILSAHSGGGMPAVDALAAARRAPDELHVFDGLYGRDPRSGDPLRGLDAVDHWLGARLAAEPQRPGALRVLYIERQTGPFSRAVGGLIDRRFGALEPGLRDTLAARYRVEPALVPHSRIARRCAPELLAGADAAFDWSR